jgi:pyruvate dehydrogenase E2 component (dihydrolipoamide acetyltransferase)
MGEFLMPSLGADMERGTVLEWRVRPGDVVHRGDIVAVVDTEKSDIDVEVFEDGVVEELLVEVGREVEVGTPLARITSALPAERRSTRAPERVRASPLARRRAAEQGVDLAAVRGSGPGAAVTARDVTASEHTAPVPPSSADRAVAGRRAVGELMARSKREIPHYYLATTIDLGRAQRWLTERNAERHVTDRVLPAVLLLKATALAVREVPAMNGFWDGAFQPSDAVHLGVAISRRGGGLIAPAIHDADTLSVDELMAALRDLVDRTRSGHLRASEMTEPTLTVTNLGERGAEEVFGVIRPPQVALVGFGTIVERPWAVDGLLGVRPTVRATLAADHRVTDGHEGSRFLTAIDDLLQGPEDL